MEVTRWKQRELEVERAHAARHEADRKALVAETARDVERDVTGFLFHEFRNDLNVIDGVIHYCVANMPGAVSRTSTFALTNATQPYLLELAGEGLEAFVKRDPLRAQGLNVFGGKVFHRGVSKTFQLPLHPIDDLPAIGGAVR